MRKIIAMLNVTPDGFCDHTAVIADEELHEFATELLWEADTVLFGRVTYQLFESYWPIVAINKTGSKSEIEFAQRIDDIDKIVFSHSLKNITWKKTRIFHEIKKGELLELKQRLGKNIVIFGSPSIIEELTLLKQIDYYYFLIQPIISGNGKRLFDTSKIITPINLELKNAYTFSSGVIATHYSS